MFKFELTLFSEEHSCVSAASLESSSSNEEMRFPTISDRDDGWDWISGIGPLEIEFEEVACFWSSSE